jgi:predicted transcriptional regulator
MVPSMTSLPLSAKLRKLIAKEMAAGQHRSPQDMIRPALDALADRRSAIAGIARGLEDMKAGRMRPWREVKRELLKRKPQLADE